MLRIGTTVAAVGLLALVGAAPAGAQLGTPYAPYAGKSPFRCQLQDVGTGTAFPRPGADPFCVKFDKTNQNVLDLGIVDFLTQEPARVAAAAGKCFYFQRDHWTGTIAQGQAPELWNWRGNYFFELATGGGGVSLADLRLAGLPLDASPFAPPELRPYLHPGGGGGALVTTGLDLVPGCVAKVDTRAERRHVYRRWYRRALRRHGLL